MRPAGIAKGLARAGKRARRVLLLGLGNPLYGDDGAGCEAVRLFRRLYRYPDRLQVADGGSLGVALVSWLGSVSAAVILDAAIGHTLRA